MTWQWWYWVTLGVTALLSFFPLLPNLANLSHEAAHWFFARIVNNVKGRIKPYWHYSFDEKLWKSPRYWAEMPLPTTKHTVYLIAPIIFDSLWLIVLGVLCWYIDNTVARIHLAIPMMGFLFDFGWFWRGYFWGTKNCDGKRWRYGVT